MAYLGLGSNVGDRLANLRAAVRLLDADEGVTVVGRSSVYETEPVGESLDQPDFYNAAIRSRPISPRRSCSPPASGSSESWAATPTPRGTGRG